MIWGTLLQRRVPDELRGRVSSLDWFVSLGLLPLSLALAGPAGEAFGITAVFIAAGADPGDRSARSPCSPAACAPTSSPTRSTEARESAQQDGPARGADPSPFLLVGTPPTRRKPSCAAVRRHIHVFSRFSITCLTTV